MLFNQQRSDIELIVHKKPFILQTETITYKNYSNMEKEMTLTAGTMNGKCITDIARYLMNKVNIPAGIMRRYYSHVLGKEVSMRQAWLLIEAQAAFFAGVLPANIHVAVRALIFVWFALAVRKCRRSGL